MANTLVKPILQLLVNNLVTTTLTATMAKLDVSLYNIALGTNLRNSGDNTNSALAAAFQKR